ncbi:hypothetical protein HYH03_017403 [Edaphochlamys debaryana]|uniref:Uncharacterized protein n=1 Tax=Edaphochlamys debaryana TaxID=47281 RepID=A0A836BQM4_9CHLO|nr:hypothetical protein HYH03_017403 [Edaphochlamys debaryana]|eukprot:KAG2483748.1 hypothetical protein HYH03_017403 [Edaphochlamys debaryana]
MGGALSSNARQVAQRVAPTRKLRPFRADEIEALNRIADQDQARMRELPSIEEMNTKDIPLDKLLNKLGGAISGRDLSPDEPPEASTSGRQQFPAMPPARPTIAQLQAAANAKRSTLSPDDQPGRLQSYILREILEARTAAAAEGRELDLAPYISNYKADRVKLHALIDCACLPLVGKVATFGHQYAFARPPAWWLRQGLSGAKYKSEPTEELRRRLAGNPAGMGAGGGEVPEGPSAMFGSRGRGAKAGPEGGAGAVGGAAGGVEGGQAGQGAQGQGGAL